MSENTQKCFMYSVISPAFFSCDEAVDDEVLLYYDDKIIS